MKKIIEWLLAFLLAGMLILFCMTFAGRQAILPALNENPEPVSDSVIRKEEELLRTRVENLAEIYGFPAEEAIASVDRKTLLELNDQAGAWWSSILQTGRPTEGIEWRAEELEKAMLAFAESSGEDSREEALTAALTGTEEVRGSVIRMVLPMRLQIIEPALQRVRERADLPNLVSVFVQIPWAALALCALLSGFIALMESPNLRGALKYFGAALGAAAIVTLTLAAVYQSAGIGNMIREASEGLMIQYREVCNRTAVPVAALTAGMAAAAILCLALCRRKEKPV